MLAAAIIVFREVLEAALVTGIVLATTQGVIGSRAWVLIGIGGGLLGAAMVAASADALAQALAGMGQEAFDAATLLLAAIMLGWHNVWTARHGRRMAHDMKAAGEAVASGDRPLWLLAAVVGLAVLREGAETVLFLFGVAAAAGDDGAALGALAGLTAGMGVGALLYGGLRAVPPRHLFTVTSGLITVLAAGMAAQAVAFLAAAGLLEAGSEPVWNSAWLLAEDSLAGHLAHILVGYVDHPSLSQLAAYAATIAVILAATQVATRAADRSHDAARG